VVQVFILRRAAWGLRGNEKRLLGGGKEKCGRNTGGAGEPEASS